MNFSSITHEPETGAPKQLEGFFRVKAGTNAVALINSHMYQVPISVIEEESVLDEELALETVSIHRMLFTRAQYVNKYRRKYWLDCDVFNYELWMEIENTPSSRHLRVKYHR